MTDDEILQRLELDPEDPAGYSGSLMKNVDFVQRHAMTQALKPAYERSGRAVEAESKGNPAEAIRLWRIVFGSEFPVYG